jgi:hypothetical protein
MAAFGGKADMTIAGIRFRGRYWWQSGRALLHCICLLLTQSGHYVVRHCLPLRPNLLCFDWRRP